MEDMAANECKKSPEPADLIQIFRTLYQHWAIYVGDGEVVHFGSDCDESLIGINKSTVMRQKLTEVAGSDRFCINNELDNKYQPRDPDKVVKDALHLVGETLPYSLATSNCEHFVTGLRYGKQESLQVQERVEFAAEVAIFGLIGLGAILISSCKEKEKEEKQ